MEWGGLSSFRQADSRQETRKAAEQRDNDMEIRDQLTSSPWTTVLFARWLSLPFFWYTSTQARTQPVVSALTHQRKCAVHICGISFKEVQSAAHVLPTGNGCSQQGLLYPFVTKRPARIATWMMSSDDREPVWSGDDSEFRLRKSWGERTEEKLPPGSLNALVLWPHLPYLLGKENVGQATHLEGSAMQAVVWQEEGLAKKQDQVSNDTHRGSRKNTGKKEPLCSYNGVNQVWQVHVKDDSAVSLRERSFSIMLFLCFKTAQWRLPCNSSTSPIMSRTSLSGCTGRRNLASWQRRVWVSGIEISCICSAGQVRISSSFFIYSRFIYPTRQLHEQKTASSRDSSLRQTDSSSVSKMEHLWQRRERSFKRCFLANLF